MPKKTREGLIAATTAVSIGPGKDDLLLGFIPACSLGKGEDMTAVNTQNDLEYCDIAENITKFTKISSISGAFTNQFQQSKGQRRDLKLLMEKV